MNITAGFIGATGIVATNITGANITAGFIGATGIVASNITGVNITAGFIGATGIVATNITGANITSTGTIIAGGDMFATGFNTTSDYRIKTFVRPITSGMYFVESLNPVSYFNTISNKTDLGFIAHELESSLPMLVNGIKDGPTNQSINYAGLIPVLVSEIKDLKSQVKNLTQQLQTINDRL